MADVAVVYDDVDIDIDIDVDVDVYGAPLEISNYFLIFLIKQRT